jgi:dehydration protein DpgD
MATYEFLLTERRGHVLYVTMNRPESLNAMNRQMRREIDAVFADMQNDPDLWIGVLRGAGDRAFCAGADLKEMASLGGPATLEEPAPSFFWSTLALTKPVIAAVQGYALGGGFELALACDFIVCTEDARFGLPEVTRGITPGPGIHWIIRKMPLTIGLEYLMTGSQLTAQQALEYHLVNRVVPKGQLDAAVEELVERLLQAAPVAVRAVKAWAMEGYNLPLRGAMALGAPRWVAASEDAKEGPRAFAEKRKPVWKGR